MITPAGKECRYFYSDYFRGRKTEECRLLGRSMPSLGWTPDLCKACPVPGILLANACPNLVLEGEVRKTLLGLRRKMAVTAACSKHLVEVPHPQVGCGHCHEEHPGADLWK